MSHVHILIATLIAVALAGIGCAHRGEPVEVGEATGERRASRAEDPRYAFPPAQKRGLTIHLDSQTFEYREDDRVFASGPISSVSPLHPTPVGNFRVLSKQENKSSGKYTNYFDQNTPMPYSLQFHGPFFIHCSALPFLSQLTAPKTKASDAVISPTLVAMLMHNLRLKPAQEDQDE